MNILEIIILALTAVLVISGFQSGFIKKLASMLTFIISVALVSAVLPTVTDFIRENTPIYSYIETECYQVVSDYSTQLLGFDVSDVGNSIYGMDRNEIKDLLEQYGYSSYASMVDYLSDEELEEYKGQFLELLEDESDLIGEQEQTDIIDELPLPRVIRNLLKQNNNAESYAELAVSDFTDYIVAYLSDLILNAISFVAAVILVQVAIRLVLMLLNVLSRFPVISLVNRVAGMALGLLQALFFIWIFFLLLAVLQTTSFGATLLSMVQESELLSWLYETNLFWRILASIL